MITNISIQNMKGQTTEQPLTGMDIFTGRNGCGKTTRVQAVSYALLGYVPGQKKTAADIFKMATGNSMSVGLGTAKFHVLRTLRRSEKQDKKTGQKSVSIKESITLSPGAGECNDTEKNVRIMAELGNFPVMMDFGEFTSLSDAKRRDFIYGLSPIESNAWNRERIHRYLVNTLLTDGLQENDADQYEALQEMIAKAIAEYPVGYDVSDGLQAMLDWTDREKKYWASRQKDAQGAVRQISDQKNELEETECGIANRKRELDELQTSLIAVEKQISAVEEKGKVAAAEAERMNFLTGEIAKLQAQPATECTGIDRRIAEQRAQLAEPPQIDEQFAAWKKELAESRQKRRDLEQRAGSLEGEISAKRAIVQSMDDLIQKISESGGRCIGHNNIKCTRDFSDPAFQEAMGASKAKSSQQLFEMQQRVDDLRAKIGALGKAEAEIETKQAALLKSVEEINSLNTAINKSIAELTARKNAVMKAETERAGRLKLYGEELAARAEKQQTEAPVSDIGPIKIQADEIRTKITEIKAVVEQKEKARQALILVKQSMLDNRRADHNANCLKLIADALGPKGIQGELVKEILEPIRQDIAGNLKLMGFDCEPFFQTESDTGKEIFQFGWTNERGHAVNFDALSTGQQTVFLAAMMVTIIDRARPKTKILLMDNLNHLDRQNFQLLVNGISKIKDRLDNVILAGAIEFDFAADGWTVWNLSEETERKQSA